MSRQRDKGTKFESSVVTYLRRELGQPDIERRALHGGRDMGDVYRIAAHGLEGIAECKDYRSYTEYDVDRWKAQTLEERENAGAGFALLVIHRRGKSAMADSPSFGHNVVWVTVADLMAMSGLGGASQWDDAAFTWVSLRLCDACDLMMRG